MEAYLLHDDQRYRLTDMVTVIGRDRRTCTLVFDDELLSRRHAYIVRQSETEWVILDMNSSNGVQVNDQPIDFKALRSGDRISLGGVGLRFALEGEPARQAVPRLPTTAPPERLRSDSAEFVKVLKQKTLVMDVAMAPRQERTDFDKLLILYKVNQLVSEETDLEKLLSRVAELALEVFDADRVSIMTRQGDGGLVARYQKARDREQVESGLQHISQSISEYCLERGEAIITNDALVDGRFQKSGSIQMYNIRSAMCAPLTHQDLHFGVLYVDNRIQGEVFGEDDLRLLEAFADGVSVAIVNSQLILDLRRSINQVRNQQEALVQSEKLAAMGQLSAGVSHEIRNPLAAISGYVQFYFMKFQEGAPFYDKMQKIEGALDQINGVVEGLLDLARKGEGRMEPTHVQAILEKTLKVAEISLKRAGKVELVRQYSPGVPEIIGDPRQLQQVFLNMMVNASQAMQQGGTLTIATRAGPVDEVAGPTVEVLFRDTGCGIPAEVRATLFQPFVTRGKKGGTGLGLSISKNIIDVHGGDILADSEIGKGTTFLIRLPVGGPKARQLKEEIAKEQGVVQGSLGARAELGEDSSPELHVRALVQGLNGGGGPGSGSGEGSL